jgi:hypothetical protein
MSMTVGTHVNPNAVVAVISGISASLINLLTFFNRRKHLRNEIRENLALMQELEKDEVLSQTGVTAMWLRERIIIDVAKISGHKLALKKPVPVGSVIFALMACGALSYWTYYLNRNSFNWYSLIPGIAAWLFALSIYGMFTNRETPPPEDSSTAEASLHDINKGEDQTSGADSHAA